MSQASTNLINTEIEDLNLDIFGTQAVGEHLYESKEDFTRKYFKDHYHGSSSLLGEPTLASLLHSYAGLMLWIDKTLAYLIYLEHIDPIIALGSVRAVLNIADQFATQIDKDSKQKQIHSDTEIDRVTAERHAETIEVKREGEIVEKITVADIARLSDDNRKLIKALEDSMQKNYDLWTKIYPQKDFSPDPVHNAKIGMQLKSIEQNMCSDLKKILSFLNQLGKNLDDHYKHVQFVCKEIE